MLSTYVCAVAQINKSDFLIDVFIFRNKYGIISAESLACASLWASRSIRIQSFFILHCFSDTYLKFIAGQRFFRD